MGTFTSACILSPEFLTKSKLFALSITTSAPVFEAANLEQAFTILSISVSV